MKAQTRTRGRWIRQPERLLEAFAHMRVLRRKIVIINISKHMVLHMLLHASFIGKRVNHCHFCLFVSTIFQSFRDISWVGPVLSRAQEHNTRMSSIIQMYMYHSITVSHFSYAPFFQGPHFLTKMLESNILYDNLFIDILSV